METKFLKKYIDNQGKHIVSSIEKLIVDKSDKNVYENSKFSKGIIGICTAINTLLSNSELKINVLKKSFEPDYLVADNLENVFLRVTKFFQSFNVEEINENTCIDSKEPIESLLKLVIFIAPDLSIRLNQNYYHTITQTINCINGYSEETKEYFISLGALGLVHDNSDEKIFETVMNNLYFFLIEMYDILNEYFKEKDYLRIENGTIDEMYKNIFNRIKWYFNNETKEILRLIYKRKKIVDTELADELNVDISYLRKTLYNATKEFLSYEYLNNNSTIIFIDNTYVNTIEKYYNDLFEDNDYEG